MTDSDGHGAKMAVKRNAIAAWLVHLLTASGVVLAFFAIEAVDAGDFREALLWLLAALVIDGVDGTLARAVGVSEILPQIDGAALDLVVDYLTYVLVPVLLIWRSGLVPAAIAPGLCGAILVSSLYVFVRRDMKTEDGYFRGFPALWNVVAAYFVVVPPGPLAAVAVIGCLIVLTFTPIHVPHPFRTRDCKVVAPVAAILWIVSTAALALSTLPPPSPTALLSISLAALFVLASVGMRRTLRGPR